MNHNIFRQLGIRLAICVVIFALLWLLFGLGLGLPSSYAWAAMVTFLAWTSIVRHIA